MDTDEIIRRGIDYEVHAKTEKDREKAFSLYSQAAEEGDPFGYYMLGRCLSHGIGTDVDYIRGVNCYCSGIIGGYNAAPSALGWHYLNGYGVEQDYNKAFNCFVMSIKKGFYTYPFLNIAQMYEEGVFVNKNVPAAIEFYKRSADIGNQIAKKKLADMADTNDEEAIEKNYIRLREKCGEICVSDDETLKWLLNFSPFVHVDYYSICDCEPENEKRSVMDLFGCSYDEFRRKSFDVLCAYNVSKEKTIRIMTEPSYVWIDLYKENEHVLDYMRKNKPQIRPEGCQGWEFTLDVLLDP